MKIKQLISAYTGVLRTLKGVYMLNNLLHLKQLAYLKDKYKALGLRKPVWAPVSSQDFRGLEEEAPWLDREENLHKEVQTPFSPSIQNALKDWTRDGYAILEGFFSESKIDQAWQEFEALKQKGVLNENYTGTKVMDAYREAPKLAELLQDEKLLEILSFLLGKKAKLFQSINFTVGSEQAAHSDSIHMTTFPKGYLVAIWVALEDIQADSGPLVYYPGSHRLPYVLNPDFEHGGNFLKLGGQAYKAYEAKIQAVLEAEALRPKTFLAKKGDVLIWHANLLHGGSPRSNPKQTRRSMVGHYFAEGVVCYHEITQRPALRPLA